MPRESLLAYAACLTLLFLKFFVTILVQARTRLATKRFQYAEDAKAWNGEVVEAEADSVVRAQRVLRNDAESQPFFLAAAGMYTALGIWPTGAWLYFGVYASSRWLHALCLLRPRQPLRNIAFSSGLLCLVAVLVHVFAELLSRTA